MRHSQDREGGTESPEAACHDSSPPGIEAGSAAATEAEVEVNNIGFLAEIEQRSSLILQLRSVRSFAFPAMFDEFRSRLSRAGVQGFNPEVDLMWLRNLFFLAVCSVGLTLPIVAIAPRADSTATAKVVAAPQDDDAQRTIAAVDAAFRRAWLERNLVPAEPADDLTVYRRLSLGLTGAIPSLEEIRSFESADDTQRFENRLGVVLADRRTADYLAERFARAFVGVENGPFLLYRRRRFVSWLADNIAENTPFDAVVRHLIADEGLWTDSPAVNFLTAAVKPGESPDPDPKALAARTARAFLGVRLDCAECHNHPFDDWKQSDFQGLAAFYAEARQRKLLGLRDAPRPYLVDDAGTGEKRTVAPGVPFERDLFHDTGRSRASLAEWVTHPEIKPSLAPRRIEPGPCSSGGR